MSVDGQVLGASVVAGGTGAAVTSLATTGNPVLVGVVIGIVTIIVLGLMARVAQRQ